MFSYSLSLGSEASPSHSSGTEVADQGLVRLYRPNTWHHALPSNGLLRLRCGIVQATDSWWLMHTGLLNQGQVEGAGGQNKVRRQHSTTQLHPQSTIVFPLPEEQSRSAPTMHRQRIHRQRTENGDLGGSIPLKVKRLETECHAGFPAGAADVLTTILLPAASEIWHPCALGAAQPSRRQPWLGPCSLDAHGMLNTPQSSRHGHLVTALPELVCSNFKGKASCENLLRSIRRQTVHRKHSSVQENMSSQLNASAGAGKSLVGKYCFDDFSGRRERADVATARQLPSFKGSKMLSRSPSRLDGTIALLGLFPHRFGIAISAPGTAPASYHKCHHRKISVRVHENQMTTAPAQADACSSGWHGGLVDMAPGK